MDTARAAQTARWRWLVQACQSLGTDLTVPGHSTEYVSAFPKWSIFRAARAKLGTLLAIGAQPHESLPGGFDARLKLGVRGLP